MPPATSFAPLAQASSTSDVTRSAAERSISEPRIALPSRGSPTESDLALAAKRATKSSAILSSTTMRSVDMQIWPWLAKAPKAAAFTASSRSASSSTTSGDLPPSSSSTGLRCSAHFLAMILPTREEPVKLTRRTALCAISASTTAPASLGALVTTLTTPGGKPASRKMVPISRCVPGHISEALSTTVLPQASGMAMARTPRMTGAFHGAMPTTTPTGWR